MHRKVFLAAAVAFFLLLTPAAAQNVHAPRSGAPSKHWVVFYAHDKMGIGHTFVAFIREDAGAKATVIRAVGFYPGAGALPDPLPKDLDTFTWMIAGAPVPGEILDEFKRWTPSSAAYLTIPVSLQVFEQAQAVVREWKDKPYRLHTKPQNCIDFVEAMAKVCGLRLPQRSQFVFPATYADKLRELNLASSAIGRNATPALEALLKEYDLTVRRLDADWKWLVAELKFLESARSDKPSDRTTSRALADETAAEVARAELLLQAWMEAQQKLIGQQKETAAARAADLAQERQRLATTERDTAALRRQIDDKKYFCPRCGRTLEQCEWEDNKRAYRDALSAMNSDYANRSKAINDWKTTITGKEQALAQLNRESADRSSRYDRQRAEKAKDIQELKDRLKKQREVAAKDAEQVRASETEFASRLRAYRQERQKLEELEKKINATVAGSPVDK